MKTGYTVADEVIGELEDENRKLRELLQMALRYCDLISQDDDGLNPIARDADDVAKRIRKLLFK